jgi:hypothetical protein
MATLAAEMRLELDPLARPIREVNIERREVKMTGADGGEL